MMTESQFIASWIRDAITPLDLKRGSKREIEATIERAYLDAKNRYPAYKAEEERRRRAD